MASKTSTLKVSILGDASSMQKAFGKAERSASTFGQKVRSGLGAIAVGGTAVAGVAMVGKSFYDAAIESQKMAKQTEAVIASTGGVANVTAGQVDKLASSLSMKAGVDDELIASGANMLLTFTNVRNEVGKGNDVFDQASKLALDYSVATGTDLVGANKQLGKALNDPIKGLASLSKAGVQFTQSQKDQIRAMVESGDMLGAQKIILSEFERQFGGSAAAQATAGDKLRVVWGNVQEEVGKRLVPVIEKAAEWLSENLPAAMDAASAKARELGAKLAPLAAWLRDKIPPATALIVTKLRAFGEWISTNKPALAAIAAVIGTALVAAFTAWAMSAGAAAAATLAATWPVLAIGAAVAALAAGVVYAYNNWNWFRDAVDAVARFLQEKAVPAFQVLWGVLQTVFAWIVDHWRLVGAVLGGPIVAAVIVITSHWSKIQPVVQALIDWLSVVWGVVDALIVEPIRRAVETVIEHWDTISAGFSVAVEAVSAGVDLLVGIITGIGSRIGDVASAISSPFRTAFENIRSWWNDSVGGFGFDVPDWIPGVGGKSFKIPTMHTGGVVPGGAASEVLRVLQGGEVVLDRATVTALSTKRAQALPARSGSGSGDLTIHGGINLYGTDATPEGVVKALREAKRRGLAA